MPYIENKTIK